MNHGTSSIDRKEIQLQKFGFVQTLCDVDFGLAQLAEAAEEMRVPLDLTKLRNCREALWRRLVGFFQLDAEGKDTGQQTAALRQAAGKCMAEIAAHIDWLKAAMIAAKN